MSLTNDQITAKNFKEFYEAIRPYLNGSFPTAIANKFDKANMYSTDEQIVGRWIDGKPLYQKTFSYTFTVLPTETVIDTGITNVSFVTKSWASLTASNKSWVPCPTFVSDDGTKYVKYSFWDDNGNLKFSGYGNRNAYDGYVTLQYTKTTDTAMDIGSDTDYSTTEKIIGTWIDGKPLYQKVVDIGTLPNHTTAQISHGISNLKNVVGLFGYSTDNSLSESNTTPLPYIGTGASSENITVWEYDGTIRVRTGTNYSAYTGYVVIQYTKTTD